MIAALIVAAGRGIRAQRDGTAPKQYVEVAGEPILTRSSRVFLEHRQIDLVQVVIHPDDIELYKAALHDAGSKLAPPVFGGPTRQISTLAGLEALDAVAPDTVLIHDAARPLLDPATITAVIAALKCADGAIAALPVSDTLKRAQTSTRKIASTVERTDMWRAMTPQAFDFKKILDAHRMARDAGSENFTDDASIAEFAGLNVELVDGRQTNLKITTPEDFTLAEAYLRMATPELRIGQGYDVHKFAAGDHVWLCGVKIPHDCCLEGHSDADVAMHALTDAIYGAIGEGDIGQHFPPSDEQWRGAASKIFLRHAIAKVAALGGRIVNVDITIICEVPKIGPHRTAMRMQLASIMGLDVSRIGVKATTSEGLGFTGRREGIAALAIASVMMA